MRGVPSVHLGVARDLVVEDRLVERHRDRLGGLEAHRSLALLRVLERGNSTTLT